jgi:hypothetical protein
MTKFNLHTIDTAPAESKDILKKMGLYTEFHGCYSRISSYARKLHGIE